MITRRRIAALLVWLFALLAVAPDAGAQTPPLAGSIPYRGPVVPNSWTTVGQPTNPYTGQIGVNTTTGTMDFYFAGWQNPCWLSGCQMSGLLQTKWNLIGNIGTQTLSGVYDQTKAPLAMGLSLAGNVSTGGTGGSYTINAWNVIDNLNPGTTPDSGFPSNATYLLLMNHTYGGAGTEGGRGTLYVHLAQLGSAYNAGRLYDPFFSAVTASSTVSFNVGGNAATTSGVLGHNFATSIYAVMNTGATFYAANSGGEIDILQQTGTSVLRSTGLQIVHLGGHVTRGSIDDAALLFGDTDAGTGWSNILKIGSNLAKDPVDHTNGIPIAWAVSNNPSTDPPGSLDGINFTVANITRNAWASRNVRIFGSGSASFNQMLMSTTTNGFGIDVKYQSSTSATLAGGGSGNTFTGDWYNDNGDVAGIWQLDTASGGAALTFSNVQKTYSHGEATLTLTNRNSVHGGTFTITPTWVVKNELDLNPSGGLTVAGGGFTVTGATSLAAATATTPATTDSSTSVATTAYVQGQAYYADLFGTGEDGNVTISSGTTTLAGDANYANLTLSGTGVLDTNGWRVFVSNTLDISAAQSGAIIRTKQSGVTATVAAGAAANATANVGRSIGGAPGGSAGGTGNTTTGTPPAAATANPGGNGRAGGLGGNGGNGVSAGGTGAAGGTFSGAIPPFNWRVAQAQLMVPASVASAGFMVGGGTGGGGGGQGGGDGSSAGGGGGSGGNPGGMIQINARIIARGTNVNTGIISTVGGNGGNGANGVGGNAGAGAGAGGGGGGYVYIVFERRTGSTITGCVDISGGTGGTGGNGAGTGLGGNGGAGGTAGLLNYIGINPASHGAGGLTAGSAGSTTVTSTGAAGGAGGISTQNF